MDGVFTAHRSPSLDVPGVAPLAPLIGAFGLPKGCPNVQAVNSFRFSDLSKGYKKKGWPTRNRIGIFTHGPGKIMQNAEVQSSNAAARCSFGGEPRFEPRAEGEY